MLIVFSLNFRSIQNLSVDLSYAKVPVFEGNQLIISLKFCSSPKVVC